MPYQVYTDPNLAAQLQAQGGRDLAHGVSSGVASLVKGFTEGMEERKRLGQVAKASESFVKALTDDERSALKIPDADTFALLGARDKIGAVTGALQAQGYQRAHQEMAARAEQIKQWQSEQANQEREPGFLKLVGQMGQAPEDVPAPVGNEEFKRRTAPVNARALLGAAAAAGYRPNLEHIAPLLRALQPAGETLPLGAMQRVEGGGRLVGTGGAPHFVADAGDEAALTNEFSEDPETGQRFITRGKQVLPSGMNRGRLGEAQPVQDENGVVFGHVINTGGRANQFQRAPLSDKLTSAQKLTALTRQYTALMAMPTADNVKEAGKVHEDIQKLMGGETPAAGDKGDKSVDVLMFDKAGNKVRVPRARLGEFGGKGYKLAQ